MFTAVSSPKDLLHTLRHIILLTLILFSCYFNIFSIYWDILSVELLPVLEFL
jgi:hypothetical protein